MLGKSKSQNIEVMKTSFVSKIIVAAVLSASALYSVSFAAERGIAYPVGRVAALSDEITRGDSRIEVRRLMGAPDRRLSSNVWIYFKLHAPETPQVARDNCRTLMVTFTGNRVSDLKLVNGRALKIYTAQVSSGKAVGGLAAK